MFKSVASYCEYLKKIHEYGVGPFNRWFPLKYLIMSPMIIPAVMGIVIMDTGVGVFYCLPKYVVSKIGGKKEAAE